MNMRKPRIRKIFNGVMSGLAALLGATAPVMAAEQEELANVQAKYVEASQSQVNEPEGLLNLRPRIAIETGYNIHRERVTERTEGGIEKTRTEKNTTSLTTLTLGLGAEAGGGRNSEFARVYFNWEDNGEDTKEWTEAGFKKSFTTGDISNEIMLFGSFGDKESVGIQTKHTRGGSTLTLNAERGFIIGKDPIRLGFDLDYKVTDKFSLGGAFDRVSTTEGDSNFYLARAYLDLTQNDLLALVYLNADTPEGRTHSGILALSHFNDAWGMRTWGRVNVDEESGDLSFKGDSIWVENPRYGRTWGTVPVSRSWGIDPILDHAQVVENAIDFEAPFDITGFSTGGLVGRANVSYSRDSWSIGAGIGRVYRIGEDIDLGALFSGKYIESNGEQGHNIGLDINLGGQDSFLQFQLGRTEIGNKRDFRAFVHIAKSF